MLFWGQSEDPPTFMICGFKKEHMLKGHLVLQGAPRCSMLVFTLGFDWGFNQGFDPLATAGCR